MNKQSTAHLLMIEPVNFGFNPQTAVNNSFQLANDDTNVQQDALEEFQNFVTTLRASGIDILVVKDTQHPVTPDSIFPNNWISTHPDGSLFQYPLFAINRRQERKETVLKAIQHFFTINSQHDLSSAEVDGLFLEGTGSMVLDRINKITYACLSPRTNEQILNKFCEIAAYQSIVFNAVDATGNAIYHTNVMMCVADRYAIICMDSITDLEEKEKVLISLSTSNKTIIAISAEQMEKFAGNMLQVENKHGEQFLIMSTQAYRSLTEQQIKQIESFNPILHAPLYTIEKNGGGSARCMLAEIFLPLKP